MLTHQIIGFDSGVKKFSCLDQFLCLAFAQVTCRESLRDIEFCLCSQITILYRMGFQSKVSRSTLADANEKRDWRIYADLAPSLIVTACNLYSTDQFIENLNETVYALDSTPSTFASLCSHGQISVKPKLR